MCVDRERKTAKSSIKSSQLAYLWPDITLMWLHQATSQMDEREGNFEVNEKRIKKYVIMNTLE